MVFFSAMETTPSTYPSFLATYLTTFFNNTIGGAHSAFKHGWFLKMWYLVYTAEARCRRTSTHTYASPSLPKTGWLDNLVY